jgi:hypothetical protein
MKTTPLFVLLIASILAFNLQAKEGYHHFPEIFIGATHADSETEFTYAIEYEYKFNNEFGAGVIYERVNQAHHGDGVTLKIAMLYYHPVNAIRLGLGLGKENVGGYHPHSEDVLRASASYDYHFEHFSLAPTVAVDFIDGERAYVLGIGFIKPF